MGRELQKRKNRSSIPRTKRKGKLLKNGNKKFNVKGNAIIAENWDKKLTLIQNYRRLGITSSLNEPTGGTEKRATSQPNSSSESSAFAKVTDPLHISATSKPATQITPGEARVERDPKTGKILRVIYDEDEESIEVIAGRKRRKANPLEDPLEDIPDVPTDFSGLPESRESQPAPGVIRALEDQASREEEALKKRKPRTQSKREEEWIESLIEKHGDNVRAMARDRKLNPMQQTEGDLQRRIRRWKETRLV